MKTWFLPLFFLAVPSVAFSQNVEDCLTMQEDVNRLACFDQAFKFVKQREQTTDSLDPSKWRFVEKRDGFTNKNTSYVVLASDKANETFGDAPSVLIIRCDGSGSTDVYVVSNGYIGSRNDRIPVRYKFASSTPETEMWHESTDGDAAFLPNGYRDFRNGLETGEEFLFEITDYRGSKHVATFPQTSLGQNFEFVSRGCM